jgi:hypothetical protein
VKHQSSVPPDPPSPFACRCPETSPYRCPVCEVAWLEAEIAVLRGTLPAVNVRHLLSE